MNLIEGKTVYRNGTPSLECKKKFGKYLLYPASNKIIAGLLGGPEIRTPKEIRI